MEAWRRTWWAVWCANFVAAIGLQSFLPFFPSHLESLGLADRDDIALWAGVLYGAAPLSAAVTSPLWGALGDRWGRKLMVLRSMAAIALFVGLMAFATSPWELLVLRLLQGLFSGFVAPSATLVSVGAPPGDQGRVAGSLQTALAAGSVIGPLLGGFAVGHMGLRPVFLGVAVAAALALVCVFQLADEDATVRRRAEGETTFVRAVRGAGADLRDLWGNARLRAGLSIVFWSSFALGATSPILELHVRDLVAGPIELSRFWTSVLFSAPALVTLFAMPLWGRWGDRVGHARALALSALLGGAMLAVQALPLYAALLAARVAFGAALAGSAACSFGLAAAETHVERRGGAFGVVFSARTLAAAVAAPLGGLLSRWVGIPGLFLACALALMLAARSLRSRQRRPSARNAAG